MLRASIYPTVSAPKLIPLLGPFLRLSGALSTLPRLTEAAMRMVELRKKDGNTVSVSNRTTSALVPLTTLGSAYVNSAMILQDCKSCTL